MNALLETYLRHCMSASQRDWPKLLDMAQFSYNLQQSEATSQSPFKIMTSQQPHTLTSIDAGYTRPTPVAYKFAKEWQKQANLARVYLHKATKHSKKWVDCKR